MVALERLQDWQTRLSVYLFQIEGPISPGRHDCCLFAAGAVEAQTGVDFAADWRGRYRTYSGGLKLLRRAGFAAPADLVLQHLPETHPDEATDGDIAILPGAGGQPALGVIQGSAVYVLAESGRVGLASKTGVQRLFKVGV